MSAQKWYKTPFALSGDKTAVPNAVQGDGSVSYGEGWGPDYERDPDTDPDAKRFPRDENNQLLFDLTSNVREYQLAGFPEWVTAAQNDGVPVGYPINACVRWNGGAGTAWVVYYAVIDNATAEPGTDPAQWKVFAVVSAADLKANQTQTNQGTGADKLVGAIELVVAAREGRWVYAGAATYATAVDLTVTMPGGASFAQVANAQVAFQVPTLNTSGGMTLKVGALSAMPLRASDGMELQANDLVPGQIYDAVSTGSQWRIKGTLPSQLMRFASAGDGSIFGYTATNTPGALNTQVTMGIGNCRDSTNQRSIPRTAPIAKSLSSQWVAGNGNGGRDQVAAPAANETWHVHAILNDTTGVTDVLLSKSLTAPNMPSGYTFFRRVFSLLLDASANIRQFYHMPNDYVEWAQRGVEWAATPNGVATGTLRDLGVPKGLILLVKFYYSSQNFGGNNANPAFTGVYNPNKGANAVPTFGQPTQWAQIRVQFNDANERYQTAVFDQYCSTNAQVYTASNDTGDLIAGGVIGYTDNRGRFV